MNTSFKFFQSKNLFHLNLRQNKKTELHKIGFYPFIFVDCFFVNIRCDYESRDCAVYTILAYDVDGKKDIFGLWIQETKCKHFWMQISKRRRSALHCTYDPQFPEILPDERLQKTICFRESLFVSLSLVADN